MFRKLLRFIMALIISPILFLWLVPLFMFVDWLCYDRSHGKEDFILPWIKWITFKQ